MAGQGEADAVPLGTEWVHVFEEDAGDLHVYRPDTADIPLSRRPRLRFTLLPGGRARLFVPGPADRPLERPARWTVEGDQCVIRTAPEVAPARTLRIVARTADRLQVREERST